jgi:hypothetical protein
LTAQKWLQKAALPRSPKPRGGEQNFDRYTPKNSKENFGNFWSPKKCGIFFRNLKNRYF